LQPLAQLEAAGAFHGRPVKPTDQAKRLKELEKENARLKRLLADAELDKAILKEAVSGKC
jgi:hypothetical protein